VSTNNQPDHPGEGDECAVTNSGGGSTSAESSARVVHAPDSNFSLAKAPVFDAKNGALDFYVKLANAGRLRWNLSFKSSDVGFADALGLSLHEAIGGELTRIDLVVAGAIRKKDKKCKAGFVKRKGKCLHATARFASGSRSVPAGTVEIKVHASAKALKALKARQRLHVSGTFTFQSALGGAPVMHSESVVVHWPKKARHRKRSR
jgi:hypothetical protein